MNRKEKRCALSIIQFHCWSRKSYAVFNTLHRLIKICTLSIIYNIIALPGEMQAQGGIDSLGVKSYDLGSVVITAGRTPVEAQQAARIVTVITRADIERAPAQNINDLLRYFAGVDIRQRGQFGVQADISIHGGTYDQTLILLNGINVTDPQTGHHNLNLPIDIESIERIEIIEGPAAKSFGPNAFNGAVNIITGNSKPNHIRLSGMLGQYGLNKESVNISNTTGSFDHFLSICRMASEGYMKNTDFSNTNLFYQAHYKLKAGTFNFQTGYNSKDFGANSFYSLKYPDQFESTKTQFVSLGYQSNTVIKIVPVFYLRRNLDLFELRRNNDSIPFNHHQTNTAGMNLNVWAKHRLGKTSLGIDLRHEHIISNVLGDLLDIPIKVPHFDSVFYTRFYSRMNVSLYAEHSVSWDKLTVNAGIMAHHNSDLKGFMFYPGIDLSYMFDKYFRLYASANKTLRMPTFTDMFYKSPSQKGNPGLKPEEAYTAEGGLEYTNSYLKGNFSFFRRWGYNMIDWVKNPASDSIIWRSMNHTRINFTGIECSLTLTPSGEGRFERIHSLMFSYTFLKADSNRNNLLSRYALDYLSHQITSGIDFRIVMRLYNSTRLTYHDRSSVYQDATGRLVSYKPFWLCDSKVYWKEKHFSIYAEATNVFNTGYYDFGGIVQPGVWFMCGISADIDYRK
ncbi:MAG: TonB-dependent receptor [Bacteroidales bacterium]|nr:TonB-dependent receptor [Bacteroidales bacterium]